jgi:hypothetical protein
MAQPGAKHYPLYAGFLARRGLQNIPYRLISFALTQSRTSNNVNCCLLKNKVEGSTGTTFQQDSAQYRIDEDISEYG